MLADRSPHGASFLVGSPVFRIILAASCNIGYLRKSRIAALLRGHGEDAHVLRAREIGRPG